MKKLKLAFIVSGLVFAGLLGVRLYNAYKLPVEKETRFMMDTYVTIYAIGPKQVTSKAVGLALDRMQEIGIKFNSLDPRSPIYLFNHQGTPISDPEIVDLINLGIKVSKECDGAFDITVTPLVQLWGFYEKKPHLPKDEEIKDAVKKIGYQHLSINNGRLGKDNKDVMIDMGGIAKGYAISQAAEVLRREGVISGLIDDGGDVYALGKKGKKFWKIGIKNPRGEDVLGYVEVEDLAVMGSGDYERFFIEDGKRYHHIFNPKTGYPTEGVASVTLIYKDPVLAQPWAKVPFVIGPKKGLELLEKIPGMEAIIITDSGEILYSSGLKHSLNAVSEVK